MGSEADGQGMRDSFQGDSNVLKVAPVAAVQPCRARSASPNRALDADESCGLRLVPPRGLNRANADGGRGRVSRALSGASGF